MDVSEAKARILEALLAHRGVQHLVDVGATVLGNPIYVTDMGVRLLALSHRGPEDDLLWKEMFPDGLLPREGQDEIARQGVYAKVMSQDQPVFGSIPLHPFRHLGARIRDKEHVVGSAVVIELSPFGEDDGEVLVTLSRALLLEMLYQGSNLRYTNPSFSVIADAIEGRLSPRELAKEATSALVTLGEHPCIALVECDETFSGPALAFARQSLEQELRGSLTMVYEQRLLLLLDSMQGRDVPVRQIEAVLAGSNPRIGISREFTSLAGLQNAYMQASEALRIAARVSPGLMICRYDDFVVEHFFSAAAKSFDLRSFCDHVSLEIVEHDRCEGTRFQETLETYFSCQCNAYAAARLLGIHKNTMYDRLKRIEELFSLDLSSGRTQFVLMCSFAMLSAADTEVDGF